MDLDVCWHTGAWIDVLNLHPIGDVPRERMIAEIERCAETLAAWRERDADYIGDLPWAWVLPQAKLFDIRLPDGASWGFRDLRLFCLDGAPVSRVCILAVHAEGRRYLEESFLELLERMEDVHRQHREPEP